MPVHDTISQRELRLRSREIMDAVETGSSFTVTRDGREIGELIPLRRRSAFVPRQELQNAWAGAPSLDVAQFRADIDAIVDPYADSPSPSAAP